MIHKSNILYSILLRYVKFVYRRAFRQIEIRGQENIPSDGAIIFAPNHTNAFMDAFTVLEVAKREVVFVARADVFRNPIAAKIFNFLKIMPIMRMRDGRENLKKNEKIMQTAVEVLKDGVPFCIFCEGTHRMKHSILPLVKGIFRIAIQADEALKGDIPVYIVPIGIEYGSFERYRSTIAVQVGKAFNVSEYLEQHKDKTQPELMNIMRDELSNRISSLYHCVPDTDDYEAILDYCYSHNSCMLKNMNLDFTPYNIMLANRAYVDYLRKLEIENNNEYNSVIANAKEFSRKRRDLKIEDESLYVSPSYKKNIIRILTLIVSFPYFLYSVVVDLPVSVLTWLLFHFVIEDGAMKNSLRVLLVMLFYPLIFLVLGILLFSNLHWLSALILFLSALPANLMVHDYVKTLRVLKSDYIFLKKI